MTDEEKLVKGAVEEYSKLCLALTQMTDCLPRIELYTEAFLNSSLIQDCVNQFYVSMLRFWTRACKFYSRHRLWNFVRVAWNDFDDEFRELQIDMNRCRDQVESASTENGGWIWTNFLKALPLLNI